MQCAPAAGDVPANVAEHARLIRVAADAGAQLVLFPVLSLTGYEPDLIDLHGYRVDADDPRLDPIRSTCRSAGVHAFIGAPLRPPGPPGIDGRAGPSARGAVSGAPKIGVLHADDRGGIGAVYQQRYLEPGEIGIFGAGPGPAQLDVAGRRVGFALGGDLAQPAHTAALVAAGVQLYLAGALFRIGAEARLAERMRAAAVTGMWAVLAQYCGGTGGGPACGGSGGWSPDGAAVAQLDRAPGVALVDLPTVTAGG